MVAAMGGKTRGTEGDKIRAWTGITAPRPTCHKCTWVNAGKVFKLKFANRSCRQHGRTMR